MENTFSVPPGHVIATGAGELSARQGLNGSCTQLRSKARWAEAIGRFIFSPCVRNALEKMDQDLAAENLRSILFPLLGTGTAVLYRQGIAPGSDQLSG